MKNQENFFFHPVRYIEKKDSPERKKTHFKLPSIFFLEEKFFLCLSAAVLFS